jgi:hypothetical protein
MSALWDELKKHIRNGEALFEGNVEHEAILVARKMHADRLAENEAAAAKEVTDSEPNAATTAATVAAGTASA